MKTALSASLFAALLSVGCGDSDRTYAIEEVRADRAPEIPSGPPASDLQRLGLNRMPGGSQHGGSPHGGAPPAGHGQPTGPTFKWDLPEGWKVLPPKQFRDANFTLERDPSVECFLTIMSGGGGGLTGNVNRWRGQMKQPALSPEEIGRLPRVKMFGGDAALVELTGTYIGRGGAAKHERGR